MGSRARVCIVIVNWNGARDTIECLETLVRVTHQDRQIVVCDNASSDSSIEKIQKWAGGDLAADIVQGSITRQLLQTPRVSPLPIVTVDREVAEKVLDPAILETPLLLVRTGDNLGFAGGNNVAMRYALNSGRFDYVWLINNDTVVEADALSAMIERTLANPRPAICGSKLLFYSAPDRIQALGGARFNKWTGISSTTLGRNLEDSEGIDHRRCEKQMSYVAGASCLLPIDFIREVGLMSEDYFLYCEEIDWSMRAGSRYDLVYAEDSRVYHKEGGSIGSPTGQRSSSLLSDFYIFRNKLKVVRRFNPLALPIAFTYSLMQAANRLRRGDREKAFLILKILFRRANWQV